MRYGSPLKKKRNAHVVFDKNETSGLEANEMKCALSLLKLVFSSVLEAHYWLKSD